MHGTLLQIDNFAPDAMNVREAVIKGEFKTETGPDGFPYTGISRYEVPHWAELISEAIGKPATIKLSVFRLNLKGEFPHSWVHSDEICAQYASVLYLNPSEQCRGGTAFWRHREFDLNAMPLSEDVITLGLNAEGFAAEMSEEWKDLANWEQCGFVGMRFNRFITYPTRMFHSRYPFEGFGAGPEDGRLIWAAFFDV